MIYIPGDTLIHRLDARVKILGLLAFSICLFLIATWPPMMLACAFVAAAVFIARIPWRALLMPLVPVIILAAFSLVFALASSPDIDGLSRGSIVAVRMIILVAASMVVCLTTTSTQLVSGFSRLIAPLSHLGVPTADIAFTLSLAIRFIPVIAREFASVRNAQRSRGGDGVGLPFMRRLQVYGSALSAVFIGLFRHASALGDALDSRCFGGR